MALLDRVWEYRAVLTVSGKFMPRQTKDLRNSRHINDLEPIQQTCISAILFHAKHPKGTWFDSTDLQKAEDRKVGAELDLIETIQQITCK